MTYAVGLELEARVLRELANCCPREHSTSLGNHVHADGNVDPGAKGVEVAGMVERCLRIRTFHRCRNPFGAVPDRVAERHQPRRTDGTRSVDELQRNAQPRVAPTFAARNFAPGTRFRVET